MPLPQSIECCCVVPPPPQPFCEFTLANLPVLTIAGMSSLGGWSLDVANCCATQVFRYDEVQPYQKNQVGPTMTYDKTTTCETEYFSLLQNCPITMQIFWVFDPDEGDYVLDMPPAPPYVNCGNPPTSLNTVTKTVHSSGGNMFCVAIQPKEITVTLHKVVWTCPDAEPVTKYVMRSKQIFGLVATSIQYSEGYTTYAYANSDPVCWLIKPNSSFSYPFNLNDWIVPDDMPPAINDFICYEKVFDAMPTGAILFDTCPQTTCTSSICMTCDCEPICVNSGTTGQSEPSFGFCQMTPVPTIVTSSIQGVTCGKNYGYYWNDPDGLQTLSIYNTPFETNQEYYVLSGAPGPIWPYEWQQISGTGDIDCNTYPQLIVDPQDEATAYCWPWPRCMVPHYDTDFQIPPPPVDLNKPITLYPESLVGTQTRSVNQYRIVGMGRIVFCSGYVPQEICFNPTWTVVAA